MTKLTPIRYDRAGKPIRVPPRFEGTYEEFADLVDQLDPSHCSYPNGHTLDKQTKKPCRRCKLAYDACEVHGMTKARKGLRYAKYLQKDLAVRMAEAHVDPDLLSIGHDVDFFSIRLSQLMERLGTGESQDAWEKLRERWNELVESQREQAEATKLRAAAAAAEDNEEFERLTEVISQWANAAMDAIKSIGRIITSKSDDEKSWNEALQLSERVSRLKLSETSRRKEAGMYLNIEQAMMLVQQLSDIVTQEVEDKNTRATIALRFAALIGLSHAASVAGTAKPADLPIQADGVTTPRKVSDILAKHVK